MDLKDVQIGDWVDAEPGTTTCLNAGGPYLVVNVDYQLGDVILDHCPCGVKNAAVSAREIRPRAVLPGAMAQTFLTGQGTWQRAGSVAEIEWDVPILEPISKWSPPRCECGSEAVGSNRHSSYCPKALPF